VMVHKVRSAKILVGFVATSLDGRKASFGKRLKVEVSGLVAKHEVPHRIVPLKEIPLTVAGKADRKSLSKILDGTEALPETPSSPSTPSKTREAGSAPDLNIEDLICGAFEQVLGRSGLGKDANFFEEGGTSLSAMELSSEITRITGLNDVTMGLILKLQSISSLVEHLQKENQASRRTTTERNPVVSHSDQREPTVKVTFLWSLCFVNIGRESQYCLQHLPDPALWGGNHPPRGFGDILDNADGVA